MDAQTTRGRWLPEALPPLRGWGWSIFLVVWVTVLGFTLYGTALFVKEMKPTAKTEQLYGIQTRQPQNTGVASDGAVVQFPLGQEARAARIVSGDRVVAINGRPLGDNLFPVRGTLEELGEPAAADFVMRSADGRLMVHHLTRSIVHVEQGYAPSGLSAGGLQRSREIGFLLAVFVAPIALAVLLLVRRAHDALAPWISLTALLTALGVGPPLFTSALGENGALSWALEIASPLAGWTSIAVLALFPDASLRPRWTWAVILGTLPLLYFMRTESPASVTNTASLIGQFAAVAVVVARFKVMPQGAGRQQIQWALFGFVVSLFEMAFLVASQALSAHTSSVTIYTWSTIGEVLLAGIGNILLLAAMTLGVMRYRLYDANATISRSVAYGTLTLALIGIFAGSQKVIQGLGEQYLNSGLGTSAGVFSAMMAAALVGALRERVIKWAEVRFQGGLIQLRHSLPLLVGDMRETATPAALADAMLARLGNGVRALRGAVIVGDVVLGLRGVDQTTVERWLAHGVAPIDKFDKLHSDRDDPLFPMRVPLYADSVGLVGWLLLGPRPDGSFYGSDERQTLNEIAAPAARAFATAIEWTTRREREEDLYRRFEELRRLVRECIGCDARGGRIQTRA